MGIFALITEAGSSAIKFLDIAAGGTMMPGNYNNVLVLNLNNREQ